ncbi:MAG: membrane protein insertase YidC, partial [Deltaproteobacteria bacterium]|nr:membrane protein insertase YidC [Deltaproteobacteria bacterium]
MERGSLVRWLLIGVAVFLFIQFVWPAITGKDEGGESQLQPLAGIIDNTAPPEAERTGEVTCAIDGNRFRAELTSKGGALKHVWMKDGKYAQSVDEKSEPIDLVTTTAQSRMSLRTDLREPTGAAQQVPYNDLDWKLGSMSAKRCTFTYEDDKAKLEKVIAASDRAFELAVTLSVTNKAAETQKHRLSIEQTDWRTKNETVGGFLQRAPEFMTRVETRAGGETERLDPSDFAPSEFSGEGFTNEMWRRIPGDAAWTAVASSYFAKAVIPIEGPEKPAAEMLIEEWWDHAKFPNKDNDPNYGHVYRARLSYPIKELATGQTATYEILAYVGPKERANLGTIGGTGHEAIELLD